MRWIRATLPVPGPLRAAWGSSLRLRTMALTGAIAISMVSIMGALVLDRISTDLYSSKRDQALQDSARATLAAQEQLDSSDATDLGAMNALAGSVRSTVPVSYTHLDVYKRQARSRLQRGCEW